MLPPYYRIELFGGLCLVADGHVTVRFRCESAESLLALLAYRPETRYRRVDLCRLLWPGLTIADAALRLNAAVAALQLHLEPSPIAPGRVLRLESDQVFLAPGTFETDVAELRAALALTGPTQSEATRRQALCRAMLLYTGELLAGMKAAWVEEERERWGIIYIAVQHEWQKLPPIELPTKPDRASETPVYAVTSRRPPQREGITQR